MALKESNRERQDAELEVIKSIYGNDVEDLRIEAGSWKPLNVRIRLTPLKGSSGDQAAYVQTKLHIICPNKYPKVVPKICLEGTQGISDTLIEELQQMLEKQANSLKGEVMIYDLSQTVQGFLHKHNKPPPGSFYEEMLQQKQKREQELRHKQLIEENQQRQTLLDEVEKRKEILKNDAKRREPRRSISESNANKNRLPSTSDSSENSSPFYRGHIYPNHCTEHRKSDKLYILKSGRKILKGCCLGHSQKGCVAYSGVDCDSGRLLYITEYYIKHSQIETKCSSNCYWSDEAKCNGHNIDSFITNLEKRVSQLALLYHKNLIQYDCVICLKKKDYIIVYLVQDFVLGTSVFSISASLGWCVEGASMVAKGVLEALIFLHNKGVSHHNLHNTTIFMDNTGTIRCTDFSLVPNLLQLIGVPKTTEGDISVLGSIVATLLPKLHSEMRDFVEKCQSDRTLSASDLLEHPFLRPSLHNEIKKDTLTVPSHNSTVMRPYLIQPNVVISTHSRLKTEFESHQWLGKGAFGDVVKGTNILDNREYAIKRIRLPLNSKQLYRKMTREVELLSRLNHENVVRYFNSWIENTQDSEEENFDSEWSNCDSIKPSTNVACTISSGGSTSSLWNPHYLNNEDSSDGIEFITSGGEAPEYDNDEEEPEETNRKVVSPRQGQTMYIQMEFCEKCTLRTAIDNNLYQNTSRLWRFFREIAEGLSHIHQQGMIHRDLKPVNIFLDSRDQIKIGDFGLATTSVLALQNQEPNLVVEAGTGTGQVGTTLYVAPELTGNASRSIYNQKVDMYTLGIILFEMSNPPFETGMERVQTILDLRRPSINIPDSMINDPVYTNTIEIIRWLLNHDPSQRPTAEELLSSDLVPPAHLEANALQEMLKQVLLNPQSKAYKHLVARCLQQESDHVLELTYHFELFSITPLLEHVKAKVVNLFRKHGAIEVNTPILTPFSRNTYVNSTPVKLMTQSGSVVILPNDLRAPFARHIAMSGINMIRRYSVDRVYREQKVFNFHPKQHYECAFDIITPNPGNHLVDAELLSIAYEITNEIPILKQKNIRIRINHTSLLRAILIHCNVPKENYGELFANFLDYIENRLSKFHLQSAVNSIMENSKSSTTTLLDLLLSDVLLGNARSMDGSALKALTKGKHEASSLANAAIRELESIVSLAQSLGVTCPIHLYAGLPISYNRASTGGVIWQMIGDLKRKSSTNHPSIIAVGERYDTMLSAFQKQVQCSNVLRPNRSVSGAGFSFSLDKLVASLGMNCDQDIRTIDVVVCVSGSRPPLKDVTQILRLLWSAGIRSGVVEASKPDEAQDFAKELGAAHIIALGEGGQLSVRSREKNIFHEKHVSRTELVEHIQKLLNSGVQLTEYLPHSSSYSSIPNVSIKNNLLNNLPKVEVIFLSQEKGNTNLRRRIENQAIQIMTTTLLQFGKKEHVTIFATELSSAVINGIVGAINPRELGKQNDKEIAHVIERFSKFKNTISNLIDEIVDAISVKHNKPIAAIFSTKDFSFRVIL